MSSTIYSLRIDWPAVIDADLLREIEEDADPRDVTIDAKVARWLGGTLDDCEAELGRLLPEGWSATVSSSS